MINGKTHMFLKIRLLHQFNPADTGPHEYPFQISETKYVSHLSNTKTLPVGRSS